MQNHKKIVCRVTRHGNFSYNFEETTPIYKWQKFLYNFREKIRLILKIK